jgi:hypothetical protein
VRENGLEGIVAKRAGSTYRSGRSGEWVKATLLRPPFRHSSHYVTPIPTLSDLGSSVFEVAGFPPSAGFPARTNSSTSSTVPDSATPVLVPILVQNMPTKMSGHFS